MAARTKMEGWGRDKGGDKKKQENRRVIGKKRIGEKHKGEGKGERKEKLKRMRKGRGEQESTRETPPY